MRLPLFAALALLLTSCLTLGAQFPGERIIEIRVGTTTRQEIEKTYGSPTRVGFSSGLETWTYMDYHANVLGTLRLRDLTVTFDKEGKVASYTYNTNETGKKL